MKNKSNHNRHSIRLKDFDYTTPWWYYVTICTTNHTQLFGDIINDKIMLTDFGKIALAEWNRTTTIRNNTNLDSFVIMPNHIHGIIIIESRGEKLFAPTKKFTSPSRSLGSIIRGFKSAVTKQINEIRKTPGKEVWQRNYYERIIRNEKELYNIRKYIEQNILKWEIEKNLPENFYL